MSRLRLRRSAKPQAAGERMPSVVIVGGGQSGLSLAYRLQQAAPHV